VSLGQRLRDALIARLRPIAMTSLVRLACWVALVGLAVISLSILYPAPLLVIFAMSVGQVIGIAAFLLYLLSVLMDIVRGHEHPPDAPGPARRFRAQSSVADRADSA
jgi:hypothetical protein